MLALIKMPVLNLVRTIFSPGKAGEAKMAFFHDKRIKHFQVLQLSMKVQVMEQAAVIFFIFIIMQNHIIVDKGHVKLMLFYICLGVFFMETSETSKAVTFILCCAK